MSCVIGHLAQITAKVFTAPARQTYALTWNCGIQIAVVGALLESENQPIWLCVDYEFLNVSYFLFIFNY